MKTRHTIKQLAICSISLLSLLCTVSASAQLTKFYSKDSITSLGDVVNHDRTEYLSTVYPDATDKGLFSNATNLLKPFETQFPVGSVMQLQLIVELDSSGEGGFLVRSALLPYTPAMHSDYVRPLAKMRTVRGVRTYSVGSAAIGGSLEAISGAGHTFTLYSIIKAGLVNDSPRVRKYTANLPLREDTTESFQANSDLSPPQGLHRTDQAMRLLKFGPFNTIDMAGMSHLMIDIVLVPGKPPRNVDKLMATVRGGVFDDKQRRFVYDPRPLFNARSAPQGELRLNIDHYTAVRLLDDSLLVSAYQPKTLNAFRDAAFIPIVRRGEDPKITYFSATPNLKYFSQQSLPASRSFAINQPLGNGEIHRTKRWVCTNRTKRSWLSDIFGDRNKEAACDMLNQMHELRPMNQPVLTTVDKNGPQLHAPPKSGVTLVSSAKTRASGGAYPSIVESAICHIDQSTRMRMRRQTTTTPPLTFEESACNDDGGLAQGAVAFAHMVEHGTEEELSALTRRLVDATSSITEPLLDIAAIDEVDLEAWYNDIHNPYAEGRTDVAAAENFLNATQVTGDQQTIARAIAHGVAGEIVAQATTELNLQPYITASTDPSTANLTVSDIGGTNQIAASCDYTVTQSGASTSDTNPYQECARLALQAERITSGTSGLQVVVRGPIGHGGDAQSRAIRDNHRADIMRAYAEIFSDTDSIQRADLQSSIEATALDHTAGGDNLRYLFIGNNRANNRLSGFSGRFYFLLNPLVSTQIAVYVRSVWNPVGVTTQSQLARGLMSLVASRDADQYYHTLFNENFYSTDTLSARATRAAWVQRLRRSNPASGRAGQVRIYYNASIDRDGNVVRDDARDIIVFVSTDPQNRGQIIMALPIRSSTVAPR